MCRTRQDQEASLLFTVTTLLFAPTKQHIKKTSSQESVITGDFFFFWQTRWSAGRPAHLSSISRLSRHVLPSTGHPPRKDVSCQSILPPLAGRANPSLFGFRPVFFVVFFFRCFLSVVFFFPTLFCFRWVCGGISPTMILGLPVAASAMVETLSYQVGINMYCMIKYIFSRSRCRAQNASGKKKRGNRREKWLLQAAGTK